MRVLFVSDTHLGFDLPAHARVNRRRRGHDFFDNFERALAPAHAGDVDVVLHGGDLHFRARVSPALAAAALEPLLRVARAGVPVLLVPGNHERSRLPFPLLALHPRLHVFDRPRTFVLEARGVRVAFVGFPYANQVRERFGALLAGTGHGAVQADVRVLCLHQCVEGATCGPGTFTFRSGDDVIRRAALPASFAAVLSGHVHRHQVMPGAPPVIYAGSVERTSFAEVEETKGSVLLELTDGLVRWTFAPLPARPMLVRAVDLAGLSASDARRVVAGIIDATPADAVLQLRVQGGPGASTDWLTAAALRELSGERNVSPVLAWVPRASPRVPFEPPSVRRPRQLALGWG
ncbi:MAG: metallophosphoesterase [Myxococcaceae bacterium]|nr:metallophosphoesterase [Myxococcaceae bacterium]